MVELADPPHYGKPRRRKNDVWDVMCWSGVAGFIFYILARSIFTGVSWSVLWIPVLLAGVVMAGTIGKIDSVVRWRSWEKQRRADRARRVAALQQRQKSRHAAQSPKS